MPSPLSCWTLRPGMCVQYLVMLLQHIHTTRFFRYVVDGQEPQLKYVKAFTIEIASPNRNLYKV